MRRTRTPDTRLLAQYHWSAKTRDHREEAVATIQIRREFTMPRKKLRKKLEELAANMQDKWQLDCQWQSKNCLDFQRSGAKGTIEIHKHELELNAELGMLMSAFKDTIEEEINKFIDQHVY